MIKRLSIALALLLVALAGGGAVLLGVTDWARFKPEIVAALEDQTGLEISIGGPLDIEILPQPSLTARNVEIANPRVPSAGPLARAAYLEASIEVLPLLGMTLAIDRVKVEGLEVGAQIGPEGFGNWETETTSGGPTATEPNNGEPADLPLAGLRVDELQIGLDSLTFEDQRNGDRIEAKGGVLKGGGSVRGGSLGALQASLEGEVAISLDRLQMSGVAQRELHDISLGLAIPQPGASPILKGGAGLVAASGGQALPVTIQGQTGPLAELSSRTPWPVDLDLETDGISLGANGEIIGLGQNPKVEARLEGTLDDLQLVAALLGMALPDVRAIDAQAHLASDGQTHELSDVRIAIGRMRPASDINLDGARLEVPALRLDGAALAEMARSALGEANLTIGRASLPADLPLHALADLQINARLEDPAGPLALEATFDLAASPADTAPIPARVTLSAPPLPGLLEPETVPIDLEMVAADIVLAVDGEIRTPLTRPEPSLSFTLKGDGTAVLARLAGTSLPDPGPFRLSARLDAEPGAYRLDGLSVALGPSDVSGAVVADFRGAIPKLDLDLRSRRVDLAAFELAPGRAAPAGTPESEAPADRGDLIPDTPLPLDLLDLAEATVTARIAELRFPSGNTVEGATAAVVLKDGRLDVANLSGTYEGGRLRGRASIDGRTDPPALTASIEVDETRVAGPLGQLGIIDASDTVADIDIRLTGMGSTPRAIAASLSGRSSLVAEGGNLDLGRLNLFAAGLGDLLRPLTGSRATPRTEINCLVSRFEIVDGLATSRGLLLDMPSFAVIGQGHVDLGTERLDFRLDTDPHQPSLMSFAIPIRVRGPLAAPRAAPDAAGAAKVVGMVLSPALVFQALVLDDALDGDRNRCEQALDNADHDPADGGSLTDRVTSGAGSVAEGAVGAAEQVGRGAAGAVRRFGDGLRGLFD